MQQRRQWHPTPVLLPGKSHGQRSLEGCSPWGRWGLDTTERLHFHFSLSCIGEGNNNRLQCSCLENSRDRGAWWAAVYGVSQSWTRLKRLSSSSSSIVMQKWIEDTLSIISNFPENSAEPDKELLWRSPPTCFTQAWPMYCVAVKHSPGEKSLSYTGIHYIMNVLPKKVSAKRLKKKYHHILYLWERDLQWITFFFLRNNCFWSVNHTLI